MKEEIPDSKIYLHIHSEEFSDGNIENRKIANNYCK